VTVRDTTERPETVECGSNLIGGVEPEGIRRCVHVALAKKPSWTPPPEYTVDAVSPTAARIVLGTATGRRSMTPPQPRAGLAFST
jgi:UDP-N-acetylglucosamine 2-epimerase (non-hydrolysing)